MLSLAMTFLLSLGASAQKKGAAYNEGVRMEPLTQQMLPQKAKKTVTPGIVSFARTQKDAPRTLQTTGPRRSAPNPMPPMMALGDGTTIFGSLAYAKTWTDYNWGIYSFKSGKDLSSTKVCDIYGNPNGGGTIMGDKFVYNYFIYTPEMGFTFTTLCQRNMKTGEETKVQQIYPDQSQITYALAYDRTTDQMFALSYMTKFVDSDQLIQKYVPCLATLDVITGRVTAIAELPKMAFLAITPGGEMYAASAENASTLYTINKTTGAYSEVGPTGVSASNYTQAATFDAITGKLYWACMHLDGSSALYEVNTKTGAASKISDFAEDEEYTGLYIQEPEVAAAAPGKPSDIKLNYTDGSLTGTVSGKAPATTSGGAALTGSVTVKLTIDRTTTDTKTVAAGASFTFSPAALAEGVHNFDIVVSNASGDGPHIAQAKYIGIDAPAAPSDVTLTAADGGKAHIAWTAPVTGKNDGYIDPAQLTYRIVRQPGNTLVAESVSGTSYDDEVTTAPDNYYYEVTAFCGGRQGHTGTSNKGVFGTGSTLPYQLGFESKTAFELWTVIDANHDFNDLRYGKWQYGADMKVDDDEGKVAVYKWHNANDADDWIISPPFKVEKGKKYEVTYLVKTRSSEEQLQVAAGDLNTVERMVPITEVMKLKSQDYLEKKAQFTATKDGNFYVGFHALSKKNAYYLILKSISIDEVPNDDAPAAVEQLTATADPTGALKATVAFKAPSKTKSGAALTALTKVDIFHGNDTNPAYTFTSVTPGQQLSWTDNVPQMGSYTYRVVAANAAGAGTKAEATVYVGPDLAKAVGELKLAETGGKPVITWTAPTEGINGGYVDAASTTYRITRICDHSALNRVLATRHKGTTFTDEALDPAASQYLVSYEVAPVTAAGEGEAAETESIIYGNPYSDGFTESFPSKTTQTGPWTVSPVKNNMWQLKYNGEYPACEPADKDGGLIVYVGSDAMPATTSRLISPKISVKDLIVPVLKFCIFHYTDQYDVMADDVESNTITVEAALSDGDVVTLTPTPIKVSNGYSGWMMYTVDLRQLKTADWFQLAFAGTCNDSYGYDIALDMISITNENDIDLTAYAFAGPTKVNAGRDGNYTLTVKNIGYDEVSDYTVEFLRDGNVIETKQGEALKRNEIKDFSFTASSKEADYGKTYSYTARINVEGDRNEGNNTSRTVKTTIVEPLYPEVYTVNAQKVEERKAFIFWNTPDAIHINDDFESYPAWAIGGVGNYTLTDVDGKETFAFQDMQFTHANDPKAYIVFNPDALGASILDEWKPNSGSQVMASFAANGAKNDDWLISPTVYGGEKISFYARTAGDMWAVYGFETFEVLYSSTTKDPAEFHPLSGEVETEKDWKKYEYELPQNAKYFAIRCTSNDKFVFYLDDLSYVEKVDGNNFQVTGYNVYRNGELYKQLPATQTNMFDENLEDGLYMYNVAAVYANGETGKSKSVIVTIGTVGIDAIDAADAPRTADVYTLDGRLVGKRINTGTLTDGVYLINGKKVSVKK